MMTLDEKSRMEYAALMNQARDAERMAVSSWMAAAIAAAFLLAWGIGSKQPGALLPAVLAAAAGFLATARWREQAMLLAGYIEAHHETPEGSPAFHTRMGRLQGTLGAGQARDWHVTALLNAIACTAGVAAWMAASNAENGELWAGLVTGCTLALASYSFSETARMQQIDGVALWRRSEGQIQEVRRSLTSR